MRAVGVNEQAAGGTWMWEGARPEQAAGAGCLRWLVSTTPASANSPRLQAQAPIQAADVCQRLAPLQGAGLRQHLPWFQMQSSPAVQMYLL